MSENSFTASGRSAGVIGLGLIGGSIAQALVHAGWIVGGVDRIDAVVDKAVELGLVSRRGLPADAVFTVVATPVDSVIDAALLALAETTGFVLDTGSVKGHIAGAISDSRFVPTHPMAGSEQSGLSGARADLFQGAAWVLTPTPDTSDEALAFVHDLVVYLGADPLTLTPESHDRMVATVSHVPHLTAAALMTVADNRSEEHLAMLRLAAGGFRDMTRIAAGAPDIWPPICLQNGPAIVGALDDVIATLKRLRKAVEDGDGDTIGSALVRARQARVNLPGTKLLPPNLAEVRVRIKDERGQLAAITGLAAELDVNIFDVEIAHSPEGPTGVIVLLVDDDVSDRLRGGLLARGYRPSIRPLT